MPILTFSRTKLVKRMFLACPINGAKDLIARPEDVPIKCMLSKVTFSIRPAKYLLFPVTWFAGGNNTATGGLPHVQVRF